MRKQQGFTLIELVTVIVILGILAAFAVPRFVNLSSEAKAASIKGLSGSVKAASALAHAAWMVDGGTTAPNPTTITMGGQDVAITNGYPSGTTDGIVAALNGGTDYQNDSTTTSATVTFWQGKSGSADDADCHVQYEPAANTGDTPSVTAVTTCQ